MQFCTNGCIMPPSVTSGTLYADWLLRREWLREYHGEREPTVATQLRVLDYLVERYRDDAEALRLNRGDRSGFDIPRRVRGADEAHCRHRSAAP